MLIVLLGGWAIEVLAVSYPNWPRQQLSRNVVSSAGLKDETEKEGHTYNEQQLYSKMSIRHSRVPHYKLHIRKTLISEAINS